VDLERDREEATWGRRKERLVVVVTVTGGESSMGEVGRVAWAVAALWRLIR